MVNFYTPDQITVIFYTKILGEVEKLNGSRLGCHFPFIIAVPYQDGPFPNRPVYSTKVYQFANRVWVTGCLK